MTHGDALRAGEATLILAALGLDQVAVGQVLLSQPLVGGWLLGIALGDPGGGLLAGAFFQLLCLTDLPVGASVPPDMVFGGLLGSASFVLLRHAGGWSDQALLGLLALALVPAALLARAGDLGVRRANRVWGGLASALVARGRPGLAQAAALGGVVFFFLRGAVLAAAVLFPCAAWGGAGLGRAAAAGPPLALFARVLPLLGLAALVAQRRRRGWPAALAAGAGAGLAAAVLVR